MIWVMVSIAVVVLLGVMYLRSGNRKTATAGVAQRQSSARASANTRTAKKVAGRKQPAKSDRKSPPRKGRAAAAQAINFNRWAAVSVKPGNTACAASMERGNKRYLEAEAPLLPLENCNCQNCQCTFERHDDRRQVKDDDRRLGVGLISELYNTTNDEPERRKRRRGRRSTDHL